MTNAHGAWSYLVGASNTVLAELETDAQLGTETRRKIVSINARAQSQNKLAPSDMAQIGKALEEACKGTLGYLGDAAGV